MNTKIATLFDDYYDFHRNAMNQKLHYFGVYAIVVSVLGLLSLVTFGSEQFRDQLIRPDLGLFVMAASLFFYFYMDWKLAIPFTLVLMGCYFLGRSFSWEILVALQIGGWIIQFIGHLKYEKRKPALFKNLTHMLVGPFWLFAKVIGYGKAST